MDSTESRRHDPAVELEVRCQPGEPCLLYTERMQAAARLRARGDEPAAQVLIGETRWHRLRCLHPELDEIDR
jgi:hypothetical protein